MLIFLIKKSFYILGLRAWCIVLVWSDKYAVQYRSPKFRKDIITGRGVVTETQQESPLAIRHTDLVEQVKKSIVIIVIGLSHLADGGEVDREGIYRLIIVDYVDIECGGTFICVLGGFKQDI